MTFTSPERWTFFGNEKTRATPETNGRERAIRAPRFVTARRPLLRRLAIVMFQKPAKARLAADVRHDNGIDRFVFCPTFHVQNEFVL